MGSGNGAQDLAEGRSPQPVRRPPRRTQPRQLQPAVIRDDPGPRAPPQPRKRPQVVPDAERDSAEFQLRLLDHAHRATGTFPATERTDLFVAALKTLAQALEAKDPYTSGHSSRVSAYATALARKLHLPEDDVAQIGLAADLHDIGKIGIPERLLLKPGKLQPVEYHQVMEHTVIGERILLPLFCDCPVVLGIVRWHHERVDGGGLPDGLRGGQIPLQARIVAVADAFDAMTSVRPYRQSRPPQDAFAELDSGSGTHFDAECVRAFAAAFPTSLAGA